MFDIRDVQACALDIMVDIDKICRENGIEYSLCGGSVIGAKIYNGFIPWDDDIDLMMTRENYDKFLKVYPKFSKNNYHIENYKTKPIKEVLTLFSRVVDDSTETIELLNGKEEKKGKVFIDITVYDKCNKGYKYKINELQRMYIYLYFYKMHGILPTNPLKKKIFMLIKNNLTEEEVVKKYCKYENKCRKRNKKNYRFCSEFMSSLFPGHLYTLDLFDEYIDIEFSKYKFRIIKKYDKYLYQRYGRTEFTKENKGNVHSHIISFKRC